jgi:DNA polymerase-3 subunit delta'
MAFRDYPGQGPAVELLQRSLERGRLAHAYLFTGEQLDDLEAIALTLARTLNCLKPVSVSGVSVDCCDACVNCRKINHGNHTDVHWVRPESKSRIITVDQVRDLMREIHLKPTEAEYKVAIIVAADRMNDRAANAFLKTLEEPPSNSILVLLTVEPQRILETIVSRCLRLNFSAGAGRLPDPERMEWIARFSEVAAVEQKSLIGRYRLLDVLLQKLTEMKDAIEKDLTARSPLERYPDAEQEMRDKWDDELKAAIEAEYRRQRADLLLLMQRWLRDIWLHTFAPSGEMLHFPEMPGAATVAKRITATQAAENLNIAEGTQRLLHTNVQEALALEVGLLKLHL